LAEGETITVSADQGFLANDDTLGSMYITDVSGGTSNFTYNSDGSFTMTAPSGTAGTVLHLAYDTNVVREGSVVTFAITSETLDDTTTTDNTDPVAVDDSYSTTAGTTLTIGTAAGVLSNDTDEDGDALFAKIQNGTSDGTVTLNGNGSFTYQPDAGFSGTDSFTYEISDGQGGADTATARIVVQATIPPGTGTTGADIFQFGNGDGVIYIHDFVVGSDKIALSDGLALSDLAKTVSSYNGIDSVIYTTDEGDRLKIKGVDDLETASIFTLGGDVAEPSGTNPVPSDYDNQIKATPAGGKLSGTAQNDWIQGGADNDKINGGAGDDYIVAGAGRDGFVKGGTGADIFQFGAGDGEIFIFDFEEGVDQIALSDGLTFAELIMTTSSFNGIDSVIFTTESGDRLKLRDEVASDINLSDFIELG